MPTTILDGETYEQAKSRRFQEEAENDARILNRGMLDAGCIDALKEQAWDDFPTREDMAADAADHYWTARKDERMGL